MAKKNKTLMDVLDLILYENPATQDEIAQRLGISRRYVTQLIQPLIKDGTIKRAYMIDIKSYEEVAESLGQHVSKMDASGNVLINDMISNMAKHVHSQIEASFNAFLEYDENKAKRALEMDYATNNMVEKIRTSVETVVSINQRPEFSKSVLYILI